MASKPVVFKSISPNIPKVDAAPSKIDTPQYPDAGVEYAGFSKKVAQGNTYRIYRQELRTYSTIYTFAAGDTSLLYPKLDNQKDFYATNIYIMVNRAAAPSNNVIRVIDGLTGATGEKKIILREEEGSGVPFIINLSLKTPIKFAKGNNIIINFGQARQAGDTIAFLFAGWEEESGI